MSRWIPLAIAGAAAALASRTQGIQGPLGARGQRAHEGLRSEPAPDLLILDNGKAQTLTGAGLARAGGLRDAAPKSKAKKVTEVSAKQYMPGAVPGENPRGVNVLTSGTRFVRIGPEVQAFDAKVWAAVQKTIARIESRDGPARWAEVLKAVDDNATLPVLRQRFSAWLLTQRFRLAGVRPGMSQAALYAVLTDAVPDTIKGHGMPWWLAPSDKGKGALVAFIQENRAMPPVLPVNPGNRVLGLISVSSKVIKGVKKGYWTAVMYGSPATEAGYNVCRGASAGCTNACLGHSSGRLTPQAQRVRRIRRTLHYLIFRRSFVGQMVQEIGNFRAHAFGEGLTPAVRLNGSTDIAWERAGNGNIPAAFDDTIFYDYTKLPWQDVKNQGGTVVQEGRYLTRDRTLPNLPQLPKELWGKRQYQLTFSYSERKDAIPRSIEYLRNGGNVAIVIGAAGVYTADSFYYRDADAVKSKRSGAYNPRKLHPQAAHQNAARAFIRWANKNGFHGFGAVSGDETDARFLDPPSKWVVLYSKGGVAARDRSGFVLRVDQRTGEPVVDVRNLVQLGRGLGRANRFPGMPAPAMLPLRRGRRNAAEMQRWFEESLNRSC